MQNGQLIIAALVAAAMTLVGSIAKYANSRTHDVPFVNHLVVSIFAGALMFFVGVREDWSLPLIAVCAGLAGWHGAAVIRGIKPPGININGDDDENR